MGISNPRLSVPRDPPVWCEAETGSAANITPELPAEREKALSKHGRRRAVINPRPRMVGWSGRLGAATRVVPQRFVFRLCLLVRQRRFFTGEKSLIFLPKGLQSAARIILPQAAKFHTGSLRGIFSHAHVARENDFISLPPAGGKLCKAFLTCCHTRLPKAVGCDFVGEKLRFFRQRYHSEFFYTL